MKTLGDRVVGRYIQLIKNASFWLHESPQVKEKSRGGNGNFKPTDYQSFTFFIKKGTYEPKAQMAGAYPRFLSMKHA